MIKSRGEEIGLSASVLWDDPPIISDCYAYEIRTDTWWINEQILEGESIDYTITYQTIRDLFGESRYRKRTSGRSRTRDVWNRDLMMKNMVLIREEDDYLDERI